MTLTAEHIAGDDWRVLDEDGRAFDVVVRAGGTAADAIAAVTEVLAGPSPEQIAAAGASAAKSRVRAATERAAAIFMNGVPEHEIAAWGTKEAAATAFLAGTATERQTALIGAEAALTGETVEALAARIDARATAMMNAVASLTGLRRAADAAIDADPTSAAATATQFESARADLAAKF